MNTCLYLAEVEYRKNSSIEELDRVEVQRSNARVTLVKYKTERIRDALKMHTLVVAIQYFRNWNIGVWPSRDVDKRHLPLRRYGGFH